MVIKLPNPSMYTILPNGMLSGAAHVCHGIPSSPLAHIPSSLPQHSIHAS